MISRTANSDTAPRLWRALALLVAGLVLLLSTASVSPALHTWLHDFYPEDHAPHDCSHETTDAEASSPSQIPEEEGHVCAVTLWANGHVVIAFLNALLLFLTIAASDAPVVSGPLLAIASVDYAWPHSCGPPTV